MTTISPLVRLYVTSRRRRGELTLTSARSIEARLRSFATSYGDRPVSNVSPAAVERWLEDIGHLTPGTRASYLSSFRRFSRWLIIEGHLKRDPCEGVERIAQPRRVPRAERPENVRLVLDAAPDARARAILWLMVGCGLRCVEVSGLTWGRYDERAATIEVKGKGGHERVLPLPAEVRHAIEAYRVEHPASAGPVIRSYTHPQRGLSANTISKLVSEWFAEAGIHRAGDGRTAHSLRHTAASDVLDRCGDLRVVQALLGHSNIQATSVYLRRANLGQLREAMSGRDYRQAA